MAFFFAYGDRMNAEKMAGSIPGARLVGPGRLDGYRLAFNVNSRAWGGGAANAVPDSRSSVWGVLWELGDDEMEHLEPINRGTPEQDRVLEVDITGPEGVVRAQTFVRPTERYFDMLRATAAAQGLPDEAIRALDRARDNPQAPAPQI
jgi:gamma-glutamylcyclotransferase